MKKKVILPMGYLKPTSAKKGMNKREIIRLSQLGLSNDAIYQEAAGELGLYGVAFFGHKGTRAQKAALKRVWQRIIKYS